MLASMQCDRPTCLATQRRPVAAATPGIESNRIPWQAVPGEDGEVFLERAGIFFRPREALVKAAPFAAKIPDGCRIDIVGAIPHERRGRITLLRYSHFST